MFFLLLILFVSFDSPIYSSTHSVDRLSPTRSKLSSSKPWRKLDFFINNIDKHLKYSNNKTVECYSELCTKQYPERVSRYCSRTTLSTGRSVQCKLER